MLMDDNLIKLIDESIEKDQGDAYRKALREILPHLTDIYRQEFAQRQKDKSMPKVRISSIGSECARKLWYSYRAAKMDERLEARVLRLFNRGHMEEARLLAMLVSVGAKVIYQNEDHSLTYRSGELQGTCDGRADEVPGYNETVMLEFKTMNKSSYTRYMKEGLELFDQQYFAQVHVYLAVQRLKKCLFMAACKDNDEFNVEVIDYRPEVAEQFYDRSVRIISSDCPPQRISDSPLWWKCKFCQFHGICHMEEPMTKNCRTCEHVDRIENGDVGLWYCTVEKCPVEPLTEEQQYDGCDRYKQLIQ